MKDNNDIKNALNMLPREVLRNFARGLGIMQGQNKKDTVDNIIATGMHFDVKLPLGVEYSIPKDLTSTNIIKFRHKLESKLCDNAEERKNILDLLDHLQAVCPHEKTLHHARMVAEDDPWDECTHCKKILP